ncbi:MAG: site-specific DNA-methyltransferase [Planctomycetaceae bacterium]|nr:site-specific DNA-methyltransferase [Planctomycetaceae bacterium]
MPPKADHLTDFVPEELRCLRDPQTDLPRIAKDRRLTGLIESALHDIPTTHDIRQGDARSMDFAPESVQLVLTSPPYWTLKEYRDSEGQLGHVEDYEKIWQGLTGASTKNHPAPFPIELAQRLIRMFSFVDDTVLDPFMGTASTNIAASRCGRNSIGLEIDPHYFEYARKRLGEASQTRRPECE